MQATYESFDASNLAKAIKLWRQRGESPPDYYYWKYAAPCGVELPRGFLAKTDGDYVGCIGLIPRLWRDEKGNSAKATWFADWFVVGGTRGQGVGLAMMRRVAALSPYGFGIPGPERAQHVARKAGFLPANSLGDVLIPLNPWRFGKRGGGRLIRCMMRGGYAYLRHRPASRIKGVPPLTMGFPDCEEWAEKSEAALVGHPHLVRTPAYLRWLQDMPSNPANPKTWWYWYHEGSAALGYIDRDFYGLRRSRLLDNWGPKRQLPVVHWRKLLSAHLRVNVDYVAAFLSRQFGLRELRWKQFTPIPVFALPQAAATLVQAIDRENWWRDLLMH